MAIWAVNDKTRHIRERFPYKKQSIDLLMAEDPEFLTLCEDYDACINALRYWSKSKAPEAETRVNGRWSILISPGDGPGRPGTNKRYPA